MVKTDKRLIEDYVPIEFIGKACEEEESYKKSRFGHPYGHPQQIHKWWAARPLIACRAAIYESLLPANHFLPQNGPEGKRPSLCRANSAKFIERLCKYPGDPKVIKEAEQQILTAHAARLSEETGIEVTHEDIISGKSPRPKVLDLFAGGGAIPLEALQLGCDAYAIDLNPVAHIIELSLLQYPQKFGEPDLKSKGCSDDRTWQGLSQEIKFWGWMLNNVKKKDLADLYPTIPVNISKKIRKKGESELIDEQITTNLTPITYLWTRTVTCKKPGCKANVPLARQTWLSKKDKRSIALKMIALEGERDVIFEVVEGSNAKDLGFDPSDFSSEGNAKCPFCQTVADSDYVKSEGLAGRLGEQLMAVVCTQNGKRGKYFVSGSEVFDIIPNYAEISSRTDRILKNENLTRPTEIIQTDAKNSCWTSLYGLTTYQQLFTPRQLNAIFTLINHLHLAEKEMISHGYDADHRKAIITYLALVIDTYADYSSSLCRWKSTTEQLIQTLSRPALPMVWDFAEPNPFGGASGSLFGILDKIISVTSRLEGNSGYVYRGSALNTQFNNEFFDAIITDPPYYDNVPYAILSDFFYVWLKRSIGHLYPEHFASAGTPKKTEAVADAKRHGGSKSDAKRMYEDMMFKSFSEANRILKKTGPLVVVYAHKTTLGWATLVDSLRRSRFTVSEAWPLDTEMKTRQRAQDSAALGSSVFLVARKRDNQDTGSYEEDVRPELEIIVKERVESLWEMGISGADLLIACVGAGLRAYTKFAKVEYANGAEVPAEHFLREVESLVLENIIAQLAKITGGGKGRYSLTGIDAATRFYIFWRFTYRNLELDAGEAIIFSYGAHVELDGANGLSAGNRALVEKKKSKYKLRDYTERGEDDKLGIPREDGQPVPLIDTLHRMLWLMDNRPAELPRFLQDTKANKEQIRLIAQMLAGTGLKGGEMSNVSPSAELSSLSRLITNWKSIVDEVPLTEGQKQLDFWEKK